MTTLANAIEKWHAAHPNGVPSRPTGKEPLRPMPEGHVPATQYRYPDELPLAPTRCTHPGCKGNLVVEEPTADNQVTDLACMLCGRSGGELVYARRRDDLAALKAMYGDMRSARKGRPLTPEGDAVKRLLTRLGVYAEDLSGLVEALGVTESTVHDAIRTARRRGHVIVLEHGLYSLVEVAP